MIVDRAGRKMVLLDEVIDHVAGKHPDALLMLRLSRDGLVQLLCDSIISPTEVYLDARGAEYFLKRVGTLYINVIVSKDEVKTAYLISDRTRLRMKEKRWLRRLY